MAICNQRLVGGQCWFRISGTPFKGCFLGEMSRKPATDTNQPFADLHTPNSIVTLWSTRMLPSHDKWPFGKMKTTPNHPYLSVVLREGKVRLPVGASFVWWVHVTCFKGVMTCLSGMLSMASLPGVLRCCGRREDWEFHKSFFGGWEDSFPFPQVWNAGSMEYCRISNVIKHILTVCPNVISDMCYVHYQQ